MRSIMKSTISALCAATIVVPVYAASDSFLKLGPVRDEGAAARKGKEKAIEVMSWQFGTARKGWDGSVKGGSVNKQNVASGTHIATADLHSSDRSAAAQEVNSPRDSASGLATGKRDLDWISVTAPVDLGMVRIKVKFPWVDCAVGDKLVNAVLDSPTERYTLTDLTVSSCAKHEIGLDYNKVSVRARAPSKKED